MPIGGNQRNLTPHPGINGSADWSPDGSQIVFTSDRANNFSNFVMNADGTNVRQLTEGWFDVVPKWSPDGKRIAFEAVCGVGARSANLCDERRWHQSLAGVRTDTPCWDCLCWDGSPDGIKKSYIQQPLITLVMKSSLVIATLQSEKA